MRIINIESRDKEEKSLQVVKNCQNTLSELEQLTSRALAELTKSRVQLRDVRHRPSRRKREGWPGRACGSR